MSTLIFSHSKSIVNKAKREASNIADAMEKSGHDWHEWYSKTYDSVLQREMKLFDDYIDIASHLHDRFSCLKQGRDPAKKNWFMITIRPDCNKVTFIMFKDKLLSFLDRKCFLRGSYSFEQKGESDDSLGHGFHVHIIVECTQIGKSQVLRDVLSSWNEWIRNGYISSNCIQVDKTINPDDLRKNYLIEYKSNDGHKEKTKNSDTRWRTLMGLEPIYDFEKASSAKKNILAIAAK